MMDLATDIARTILEGFDKHYRIFRGMSAEAQGWFERADWAAIRGATRERIDLYDLRVREAVDAVASRFPDARAGDSVWPQVKRAYIGLLYGHRRPECAETFFNSVACRVLERTYYRNEYIFWRPAVAAEYIEGDRPSYRCYYPAAQGLRRTIRAIIGDFGLRLPFQDLRGDLVGLVRALRAAYPRPRQQHSNYQVQVLSTLFFRNTAAYIVGRVINGSHEQPFAVPIHHVPGGGALCLGQVLLTDAEIDLLFSLARAYFMVDMDVPSAYVGFLRRLMPNRTPAALYTAVGLQKQGKTLFYRELFDHLTHSSDRFVVAPGVRGMVMVVFTLPSFPCVFKVIRDRFDAPKQTTRQEVRQKYLFVKHHDRAGRMADTLEYADVALPLARFDPAILAELERGCQSVVERDGERLVIRHAYIEQRATPLDVFLRGADEPGARHAIREFGQTLRDLAEADIFPGDLCCKNFGLTQRGRVVFYDYDEVSPLSQVRFRRLPPPRDDMDETAAEPWFSVGPDDVFPEEWPPFMFASERDLQTFRELHGELLDPGWWAARQWEIRAA